MYTQDYQKVITAISALSDRPARYVVNCFDVLCGLAVVDPRDARAVISALRLQRYREVKSSFRDGRTYYNLNSKEKIDARAVLDALLALSEHSEFSDHDAQAVYKALKVIHPKGK